MDKERRMKNLKFILTALIWLTFASLLLIPGPGSFTKAENFVVNSLGDTPDDQQGDTVCADVNGDCTLRAAIQEAAALEGPDNISFSVSGTILMSDQLSNYRLQDGTVIDGVGQDITVRQSRSLHSVFKISDSNNAIKGLYITGGFYGILMFGSNNNLIEGNIISGNTTVGISIQKSGSYNNIIIGNNIGVDET